MYRIKTDCFLLEFTPVVHENDLSEPVNTSLMVKVFSFDYSANSLMDIDVRDLGKFAVDLNDLYENLKGTAKLNEPYGKSQVIFTAVTYGHIRISGCIDNGNAHGFTQKLYFENEIDQTYLKEFSKKLFADYSKYSEFQLKAGATSDKITAEVK